MYLKIPYDVVQAKEVALTIRTLPLYSWSCCRRGPQNEEEFESGKTSEDYLMALLKHMWTQSSEYKSAAAQDLTGDESGGDTIEINTGTFSAAAAAAAAAAGRGAGEVAPSVGGGTGTGTGTDATSPVESKPVCDCKEECKLGDGVRTKI